MDAEPARALRVPQAVVAPARGAWRPREQGADGRRRSRDRLARDRRRRRSRRRGRRRRYHLRQIDRSLRGRRDGRWDHGGGGCGCRRQIAHEPAVVDPCLVDDLGRHLPGVHGVRRHEARVAQHVHDARNAGAHGGDASSRLGREDVAPRRAGKLEALADVGRHLVRRQRTQADVQRDPLPQLAERRIGELRLELGLPGQNDLQDLLGARLQVRQQPQLLEHVPVAGPAPRRSGGRRCRPRACARSGTRADAVSSPSFRAPIGRHAELGHDVLEDLVELDGRVEQHDGPHVAGERVEHVAQQRRLPGARLADEREESLAALDAVGERRGGLLVRTGSGRGSVGPA